ncbi:rho-GTPase-activating protein 5 [Aspergillus udagawae]|nr:rho-GTPase-activating protein 5 [Aspergillus udagawae]
MVTGKSQPGTEPIHPLPPSANHAGIATSPPSKRDLASWWRQFKRNTRKEDVKEKPQGIFGVPLNVSIKYANVAISLTNDNGESFIYGYVPIVVAKCGVFLKEKATDVEGIFRLNGSAKRIKDLQEIFDSPERYGKGLDWTGYTVHDAANVLRRYLNQLPEPIVPLDFYERFREPLRAYQRQVQENGSSADSDAFDHAKAVAAYQQLIRELPPLNKQLLLYILDLLAVFASKSDQNRMTSANLSAIFQPGLLSHPQHDMSPDEYKLSQDVLIFLIENQDHFLFGMNGTAADEQTLKEVEGGAPRRTTTTTSNIRRSVSSASGGADSFRKYENLRRNVSVSSKHSRHSNNSPGPVTPTSLSGVGVHRSNTLPSKMSPISSARYGRVQESTSAQPSGLNPSVQNSRSSSRPPTSREESSQTTPAPPSGSNAETGTTYIHSSTHGPMPKVAEGVAPIAEKPVIQDPLTTLVSSPPPPVVTPTKERKLSSFFTKSPPQNGELKEPRQPNRLKKKRVPGSASESAHSSSLSLQAAPSESVIPSAARAHDADGEAGGATPRPPNTTNPGDEATINAGEETPGVQNDVHNADNSLKPHGSRTPSMNSRSSFTDHSDLDQTDEKADRREHRRSWRFPRSSKRSNEQIGLGLASPPLSASNPSAERSTTSVGSWHQSSKSSPSDLQQFANDPSQQPLSLDAEVSNIAASKESIEPEKRSLFGKFKAKVAQVRDGVRDSERDRTRSPAQPDSEKPASNHTLSPAGKDRISSRPAQIDVPNESSEEQTRSPVSPIMPSSGLPPAIPEEPRTPESPVMSRTDPDLDKEASAAVPPDPSNPSHTEALAAPQPNQNKEPLLN